MPVADIPGLTLVRLPRRYRGLKMRPVSTLEGRRRSDVTVSLKSGVSDLDVGAALQAEKVAARFVRKKSLPFLKETGQQRLWKQNAFQHLLTGWAIFVARRVGGLA